MLITKGRLIVPFFMRKYLKIFRHGIHRKINTKQVKYFLFLCTVHLDQGTAPPACFKYLPVTLKHITSEAMDVGSVEMAGALFDLAM